MNAQQWGQRFNSPDLARIGVVGAGAMGSGIALAALLADLRVSLYETNTNQLDNAALYIETQLTKRKRLLDLKYLSPTTRLEDLAGCSVVIEAIPEDLSLKQALFTQLSTICPSPAVLATNTSTLSVTAIASAAQDPSRAGGLHFFNPAAVMPLVEVVRAGQTSSATVDRLLSLARSLGKQAVLVKDTPGFIVNRVARPFYGEALRLLGEGVASHENIDEIVRLGAGFKMGPFQLMDLIGIDINFAATRSIFEQTFGETRYRPHPIQARMVAQNTFGRKSRRGFYEYDSQGNPLNNPRQPSSDENCPGEGKQITLSQGSFAPGLQELLLSCSWRVTSIAEGLHDSFAAVISANRNEGALDLVYELDLALPPETPILLQCADLTLAEAAGGMSHPERLVGFDGLFLTGRLVTMAALPQTNPSAVAAASEVFHSLGKETCLVDDSPALVLPRIVCTLVNEAAFALGESVADAGTIDTAMKLGTNFPFGPLEWGRKLGYPTVAIILDHLRREYGEERYRLAPLLRRWSRLPPP